jgi:type II secretory pathway predicted ATPase ExeA
MKNAEQDFTLPPFPSFPSTSRYIPVGPLADAVARVTRSVLAREAVSLVIGPPGTGKSLLCSLLANRFSESHDVVAINQTSMADQNAFYRTLLKRLGVSFENSNDDLVSLLAQSLTDESANPNGLVLIIDEAASLGEDVLEAIRRVTNIMRNERPVVSTVLAGGVKLDETLTLPSLESFVQRIASRCYLHPLNAEETRQYIRQSIEACEASADDTITDDAISAIHHATFGVPRLINQLMTEAIDCAAEIDESLIGSSIIDRAWASLQQLPGPMAEHPPMRGDVSNVEFGELDEAFPEPDAAVASEPTSSPLPNVIPMPESDEAAGVPQESPELTPEEQELTPEEIVQAVAREQSALAAGSPEISPDSSALFGSFDDEEEIAVGKAVQVLSDSAPEIGNLASELDIESMLHSEIVSLSHFAAENTSNRFEEISAIAPPAPEVYSQHFDPATPDSLETELGQSPGVVWYDEPNEESEDAEPAAGNDDSDLLWITEDIDVEQRETLASPNDVVHRLDPAEETEAPKLNVDFRELLKKMRSDA